jgi:hypothetical protein
MTNEPKNKVYRAKDIHERLDDDQPLLLSCPDGTAVIVSPTTPVATTIGYTGRLCWSVRYSDGSVFSQFHDNVEQPTSSIDRKNLRSFVLSTLEGRIIFALEFQPGYEFIYRRRTALRNGGVADVIHVVGWRKKIVVEDRPEYVSNINFVYESDLHIESGEFLFEESLGYGRAEQWRYPPEFIDDDYIIIE